MTWDHFTSYEVTRRRFLAAAGATLGVAACGGVPASADSPAGDARRLGKGFGARAEKGGRSGGQTANEEPQPQVVVAFGLRITNCAPCRPSV